MSRVGILDRGISLWPYESSLPIRQSVSCPHGRRRRALGFTKHRNKKMGWRHPKGQFWPLMCQNFFKFMFFDIES